jgi:FkbM family methyltransferase
VINTSLCKSIIYSKWIDTVYLFAQVRHLFQFKAKFHSDEGEDEIMKLYLPEKIGRYLDIGAGHPMRGSNSYAFYRAGWAGTSIEPIGLMHTLHKSFRRRDRQVKGVVGKGNGLIKFYEFNPTEYSTISENRYIEMRAQGMRERKSYLVKEVRLEKIIETVNPLDAYFVTIDVEGFDFSILEQLAELNCRPRLICTEESVSTTKQIGSFLHALGYILKSKTGNNGIYVHKVYLQQSKIIS